MPLLLIWAPSWGWVIAANVLLGINQGLTWSTTVIMKIDLVGPRQRGLAMGLNEAAGYGAVALTALLAGYLAAHYGLRPGTVSARPVLRADRPRPVRGVRPRDPRPRPAGSQPTTTTRHPDTALTNRQIFLRTSFTEPALSSASQAGLVNNLNFGLSWGLFPILFATTGMSVDRIGILVAVYPGGVGRRPTGHRRPVRSVGPQTPHHRRHAHPSRRAGADRHRRHVHLVAGRDRAARRGTAMVYPTLLAAVGDVAHPLWRARAVGVYRLWRDSGYAAGAIVGGITADLWGLRAAIWAAAAITVASGLAVAVRMYETHPIADRSASLC